MKNSLLKLKYYLFLKKLIKRMENPIKQIEKNINQNPKKFNLIAVHKENIENNYSNQNSELSSKYAINQKIYSVTKSN